MPSPVSTVSLFHVERAIAVAVGAVASMLKGIAGNPHSRFRQSEPSLAGELRSLLEMVGEVYPITAGVEGECVKTQTDAVLHRLVIVMQENM